MLEIAAVFFPYLFKKIDYIFRRIIGVSPRQRFKPAMAIDQGQIGINPFADINPMAVIFSCGQNKTFMEHISGIDIHRPFAAGCILLLKRIGRQLYLCQVLLLDEFFETEKSSEQWDARFIMIIGGIIKWKP